MKIYLVPDINEKDNIFMYCNYARMNNKENRCFTCKAPCNHSSKITILDKSLTKNT